MTKAFLDETTISVISVCLKEIIVNEDTEQALRNVDDWLSNSLHIDFCFVVENINNRKNVFNLSHINDFSVSPITQDLLSLHQALEILPGNNDNSFLLSVNNSENICANRFLNTYKLTSLLFIPVNIKGKFTGTFCYGSSKKTICQYESEAELNLLSTSIASVLSNNRLKEENFLNVATRLTHLLDNIDDAYAIYNLINDTYEFVSHNFEELYGCDKNLFYENNRLWLEFINKEDLDIVEKELSEIIKSKSKGRVFYRITTYTGEEKMILEKVVVGKDNDGNPEKLYIVKTDYTNIENIEKSLVETERKFKFISENLSDFIAIHDVDSVLTYASPSIKNIIGFEPADIIGLPFINLIHPEDLDETVKRALESILFRKEESRFRFRLADNEGNYKWVETYAKPVINLKGNISSVISSTRNVSEQVNAENKLKEREEQYRLISENSNDIIAIHKIDGEIIYVSPCCKQMLGYDQDELIGKRPLDHLIKKDTKLPYSDKSAEVSLSKKGQKFLSRVTTKSGSEKLLEVWLEPVIKDNKVVALQSASRDVTEREKLLKELEHSLAKERELNELRAKFVSTASHQFRTPLTVIQSGVEIMDMYLEDMPTENRAKFQKQFKKIHEEVDRLEHLMNDVLLLGRANAARTPFYPQQGDLVTFINAIIEDKYNQIYPPGRHVLMEIEGEPIQLQFDKKLLGHSIENIINNAYKYSEEGNITVTLKFNRENVQINISDRGIGIPEEDVKNLFQPFYRATNTCEIDGTGLGLSIVKEFIEKHNGEIFLTSILNKGTTVSVILPIE